MTKLNEITECPLARRSVYLSRGLAMGVSDFGFVLYHYLASEYQNHPNKKRAIFIFDRCLRPSQQNYYGSLTEIDLMVNCNPRCNALPDLVDNIAQCKALRAEYTAAAWWKKLAIGGEATRPPATLFDAITRDGVDNGGANNSITEEFLTNMGQRQGIGNQAEYRLARANLPGLRRELIDVSFDTKRLGIDEMVLINLPP